MIEQAAVPIRAMFKRVNKLDTMSTVLVVAITLVAVLAGGLLKFSVEGRTGSYSDASGLSFRYPDGWQLNTTGGDQGVLQVRDVTAKGYPTTFELRRVTVLATAPTTQVLSLVANDLAGTRGHDYTAFKLFNLTQNQTIKDLPAAKVNYVFVSSPAGVLQESLPAVVMGDDYLVRKADKVYVFTLNVTEENRAGALPLFDKFVDSAQLP